MRICFVSHSTSHFTAPYVDWFAGRGHEVHLVSLTPDNLANAINHHPWKGPFDCYKANWQYFWAVPKVRRVIREIRPDIVHAHYVPSNGMMAAAAGVHPLVITAHGSDIHHSIGHRIKEPVVRYALRRADLINPVSLDLERRIKELGIPPERIFRATLGIDVSRFVGARHKRSGEPIRIICTRWLLPIYQCDMLIRAASILAGRGLAFEILLAGSGADQAKLELLAQELNVQKHVVFRGGFKSSELPQLLAESDIYVSASKSDGTSLCLLEALAAGCFPVVSDIPANREWLTGNGDGYLFGIDNPEQLADQLQMAISRESERDEAVQLNRERVLSEGDRARNFARLSDHYERLVSERNRK